MQAYVHPFTLLAATRRKRLPGTEFHDPANLVKRVGVLRSCVCLFRSHTARVSVSPIVLGFPAGRACNGKGLCMSNTCKHFFNLPMLELSPESSLTSCFLIALSLPFKESSKLRVISVRTQART